MITFFIPVYNEEEIIESNSKRLISYLKKLRIKYEIIIVSNGSTDRTNEIGRKIEGIKFLTLPHKGVGDALYLAAKHARYNHILTLDMDLSIGMDFIDRAIKLAKKYDIIIGSKLVGDQDRKLYRLVLSKGFIFLTWALLGLKYQDYSIATKVWPTKFVIENKDIIDKGTGYVISLIFIAKRKGMKIIEIPVSCFDKRKSRFNIINETFYRFFHLLKLFTWRFKKWD